jgi:hypothetical protein
MALETAADRLVQRCSAARSSGADFPTVWNTILKKNRLVAGIPVQAIEDGKPVLKVLLASNQYLVCGRDGFCVGQANPSYSPKIAEMSDGCSGKPQFDS